MENKFQVCIKDRIIKTPYLVDASGCCSDIRFADAPLIENLKAKGLVQAHPFGGIHLDANTLNIIDAFNHRHPNLFVIGALAKSVHLVTNLLEYIAKTAEKLAVSIIDGIEERKNA